MTKINAEDLVKIQQRMAKTMSLRAGEARAKVTVHMGTCGIAAGSRKIMSAMMDLLEQSEEEGIVLTTSGCAGLCSREPMMTVQRQGEAPVKYVDLDQAKVEKIFREHVLSGVLVSEYALAVGSERLG